jgi:UDP-N-acetylglucosamine 2-epimerase (non-hydrolysing)
MTIAHEKQENARRKRLISSALTYEFAMKTIAFIFGTRPEAIKCAPVIRAMRETNRFRPLVISTGQHSSLLGQALAEFDITPHVDLAVMQPGQSLNQITAKIITRLADPLAQMRIDAVAVHGDTASTLAGALAAFYQGIPIIHIEAGLRSGDPRSPFPEEINRRIVCQLADLHLAPTSGNAANLIREGVHEDHICVTGNTVIDALRWAADQRTPFSDPRLDRALERKRPIILVSAHRRESWGAPFTEIAHALVDIANLHDVQIVAPLHPNPVVRDAFLPIFDDHRNILAIDPLPYRHFCRLMAESYLILSDSSGAEEEGPGLGKPTLVLRDITERPEAIRVGAARLVSRDRSTIVEEVSQLLTDPLRYEAMSAATDVYGDGQAAHYVLQAITRYFNGGKAPFNSIPMWPDASIIPEPMSQANRFATI